MSGKPISPEEVVEQKKSSIPEAVFDVFNELIVQKYRSGSATVKQKDVIRLLNERGFDSQQVFDNGWLDVEPVYRDNGWEVSYDKPGFNESYDAFFKFRKPRK